MLNPGLSLISGTVNVKAVLKRRGNYDAATCIRQVVRELRAVETTGEEMRLVGVDRAGFGARTQSQGAADEFAGGQIVRIVEENGNAD